MDDGREDTVTRPGAVLTVSPDRMSASVIVLTGNSIGHIFRIEKPVSVIGRSGDADIQLDEESISRHHVRLHKVDEAFEIEDLGSKNGTFLNGVRLKGRAPLRNGDRFQLGAASVVRFSLLDTLEDEALRRLYDASVRDALTGAYNRRFFDEILQKEFAFSVRHDVPLSLLMIDLDHFKRINDTFGHPAGDLALVRVSESVHKAIRAEDSFSRYGGEEFTLILREITEDVAVAVAERIRRTIKDLNPEFDGKVLELSVSIGVATHAGTLFANAEQFLAAADKFLLKAKGQGRNRVCSRWLA